MGNSSERIISQDFVIGLVNTITRINQIVHNKDTNVVFGEGEIYIEICIQAVEILSTKVSVPIVTIEVVVIERIVMDDV